MQYKDFMNKPFLSESFIEIYDNVVPKKYCDDLINYFEQNKDKHNVGNSGGMGMFSEKDGKIYDNRTGMEADKNADDYKKWTEYEKKRTESVKNTTEMTLEGIAHNMVEELLQTGKIPNTEIAPFFKMYQKRMDEYICAYVNKYKILGVTSPEEINPTSEMILPVLDVKDRTISMFPNQLQKYKKDTGHYNAWHCEWMSDPSRSSIMRTLITMLYLNDVDEGGKTEFYNQGLEVQPKAGRLVLFPAYFTHTHRGQTPLSNDKYIITSMFSFR